MLSAAEASLPRRVIIYYCGKDASAALSVTVLDFSFRKALQLHNILVPKGGLGFDELVHHIHALLQVEVDYFYAVAF